MNTEQTRENIFTHIKTHYRETILAKIQKLENTKPDDGRSISRNVASLHIFVHDEINLLYYEH